MIQHGPSHRIREATTAAQLTAFNRRIAGTPGGAWSVHDGLLVGKCRGEDFAIMPNGDVHEFNDGTAHRVDAWREQARRYNHTNGK